MIKLTSWNHDDCRARGSMFLRWLFFIGAVGGGASFLCDSLGEDGRPNTEFKPVDHGSSTSVGFSGSPLTLGPSSELCGMKGRGPASSFATKESMLPLRKSACCLTNFTLCTASATAEFPDSIATLIAVRIADSRSTSGCRHSSSIYREAVWIAFNPALLECIISAPSLSKYSTQSRSPRYAAEISAVSPSSSVLLTLAPAFKIGSADSLGKYEAALINGAEPS